MTLIEVVVGMVIIIIVTVIAYMGVSAAANFTQRGKDLQISDGIAVNSVEKAIKSRTPSEPKQIKYSVSKTTFDSETGTTKTEPVDIDEDGDGEFTKDVLVIKGSGGNVEYEMYLPENNEP
jgi:hypothetical protein